MKKLLLFLTAFTLLQAKGQISSVGFNGMMVPQYMGSSQGGTYRLPVVYRARIMGLMPNAAYKYVSRAIAASDFNSTALIPGAGNPLFLDSGSWKTTTGPSFNTGANHDTFYTNFSGEYEGWFGFIYTTNARFTAGRYIYPSLTLVGISTPDTLRYYCADSIHVLAFGKGKNADTGTGIWGHSIGKAKNFVALYDNTFASGRPLAVSMIENDALTIASSVDYYKNSVEGVAGNWGAIIPNDLASGVRRIDQIDRYMAVPTYSNMDSDGVWGPSSKSTVDPTGGLTAISFDENDAALVAPDIQFWARTSTTTENVGTKQVYVVRKYSNDQSQSVRLSVVGGTATLGSSEDYDLSVPKTITFSPGGQAEDTTVITINDDNSAEGDETIVIRLDQAVNCVIGTEVAHTITVKDNDIANISAAATLIPAKEDAGVVGIKLRMDKAVGTASTLKLLVKKQGDSSYIPGEFQLGFSGRDSIFSLGKSTGSDSVVINAKIIDDATGDPHDTFVIALRQISGNAQIVDSIITIVVFDNDGPAIVRFVDKALTVNEKTSSVDVRIKVVYKTDAGGDFTLRLLTAGSSASEGQDFNFNPTSKIINIDQNSPDTIVVSVPLNDDDDYEKTEKILFNLGSLSNIIIQKPDSLAISILNDDYPIYPIGTVSKQTSAARTLDSLNVRCRVSGTVHGVNVRNGGIQFTIIDNTGGITVFSGSKTFGYTVTEGDSIRVQGMLIQFNGLAEIGSLDTIIKLGINRSLTTPSLVNDVTEATENKMAKFTRVKLVDVSKWPTTALSNNGFANIGVMHTDGTVDTLFIDAETNVDGTAAPTGYFNVTGLGGQFDPSSPYTAGYYLAPRRLSDFETASLPVVKFTKKSDTITELADSFRMDFSVSPLDENFTYDVAVKGGTAISPTDYNFAKRTISVIKNNSVNAIKANISDDNVSDGVKTVLFVIRNVVGPASIGADSVLTLVIKDDEPDNVRKFAAGSINMYPNPANSRLFITSKTELSVLEIYSADGRIVFSKTAAFKQAEVDLGAFSKGVYTVRITNSKGTTFSEPLVVN